MLGCDCLWIVDRVHVPARPTRPRRQAAVPLNRVRIIASKPVPKQEGRIALIVPPKFRQSTATIQLNQEEAACYRNVPIVWDFRSGFYVFPVRQFSFSHERMIAPGLVACRPSFDISRHAADGR